MSEIKVNLLGNDFEQQINDSIKEIERLKNEKAQKVIEIEAK